MDETGRVEDLLRECHRSPQGADLYNELVAVLGGSKRHASTKLCYMGGPSCVATSGLGQEMRGGGKVMGGGEWALVSEDDLAQQRSSDNWCLWSLGSLASANRFGDRVSKVDRRARVRNVLSEVGTSSGTFGQDYFVFGCGGCPKGLTPLQQIQWARDQDHPFRKLPNIEDDNHWWVAFDFETRRSATAVDKHRDGAITRYSRLADELAGGKVR